MEGQVKPVRGSYLALVGALRVVVSHWEAILFSLTWMNIGEALAM